MPAVLHRLPCNQLFPDIWNLGIIGKNSLHEGLFFVCSSLNATQAVSLNFSNSSLAGFNPSVAQKTSSVSVSPNNCTITYVYVNTSGGTEGGYSTQLLASVPGASDFSSIMFNLNFSGDTEPSIINLMWPPDNYTLNSTNLIFTYNVTDAGSSVDYCTLLLNGAVVAINSSVAEGIPQQFSYRWLSAGNYNWTVAAMTARRVKLRDSRTKAPHYNTTIVCASPSQVYEEDNNPSWTTEVWYVDDGQYAVVTDEGISLTIQASSC
jgi:mannose-6-phosphate isomerase-like protein (cupin superfamily)